MEYMTDKEIMEDVLSSQKAVTGSYNTFSNECAHQSVRDELLNILRDEHNIQAGIFTEMQKRGWYNPAQADQMQIDQVKNRFSTVSSTL